MFVTRTAIFLTVSLNTIVCIYLNNRSEIETHRRIETVAFNKCYYVFNNSICETKQSYNISSYFIGNSETNQSPSKFSLMDRNVAIKLKKAPDPTISQNKDYKVGNTITFTCDSNDQQTLIQWRHKYYHDETALISPYIPAVKQKFILTLEEFDNNTLLQCYVQSLKSKESNKRIANRQITFNTTRADSTVGSNLPVKYYNESTSLDLFCDWNKNPSYHYMRTTFIRNNKIIKLWNHFYDKLTHDDNGSMICCHYFMKNINNFEIRRYFTNKTILMYKELELLETNDQPFKNRSATFNYATSSSLGQSSNSTGPIVSIACSAVVLALIIVGSFVGYKIYKKRKSEVSGEGQINNNDIQSRPLPARPHVPRRRSTIYTNITAIYSQIIYAKPQVNGYHR